MIELKFTDFVDCVCLFLARMAKARTKQRRDRPDCLSKFSVGDEVFVKRGWKGTIVRPSSDSEGDSDEYRLKYNKVAVKVKRRSEPYQRFRPSRIRNRNVYLYNLPRGWSGKIRLCDVVSQKVEGACKFSR